MRVTKYAHSCIRVEHDGGVLLIDPGMFTDPAALTGVDAVLITHEHPDHVNVDALRTLLAAGPVVVHGPASVRSILDEAAGELNAVEPGQSFTAAGIAVRAYGGVHAVIHPDIPRVQNLGYLINDEVYHPGDSLVVPEDVQVDTLFAPIHAPWLKVSEAADFVRAVAPRRAFALHDGLLNDAGLEFTNANMARLSNCEYKRLAPGTHVD